MHFIPPTPLILYIMSKISNALITQNKELHLEKSIFTVAAEGMQNFKMSWVHKSPPYTIAIMLTLLSKRNRFAVVC